MSVKLVHNDLLETPFRWTILFDDDLDYRHISKEELRSLYEQIKEVLKVEDDRHC